MSILRLIIPSWHHITKNSINKTETLVLLIQLNWLYAVVNTLRNHMWFLVHSNAIFNRMFYMRQWSSGHRPRIWRDNLWQLPLRCCKLLSSDWLLPSQSLKAKGRRTRNNSAEGKLHLSQHSTTQRRVLGLFSISHN